MTVIAELAALFWAWKLCERERPITRTKAVIPSVVPDNTMPFWHPWNNELDKPPVIQ